MPLDQARQYDYIGTKGVIGFYFQALEQITGVSWTSLVANTFTSTQDTETYAGLGNVPQLREWLGGKNVKTLGEYKVQITNADYESTIRFKNKDMRRDKTAQVQARMGELATRALAHDAKLLSTIINNGSGTTTATAYDGLAMFSASHAVGSSGTINNAITVDISALPTGDTTGSHGSTTAPSVGEMALSIMAGIKQIFGFKDDQGEPMNELANDFAIMVPVGLSDAAQAALTSVYLAQGMSNPTLVQANANGTLVTKRCIVNPRITATDTFYVFRVDSFVKAMIIQLEMAPVMKALAEGSDNEFWNNEHVFSVEKAGNVGIGDFARSCSVQMT